MIIFILHTFLVAFSYTTMPQIESLYKKVSLTPPKPLKWQVFSTQIYVYINEDFLLFKKLKKIFGVLLFVSQSALDYSK